WEASVKTRTPPLWPFRLRLRRDSANAWARKPREAARPAAGQDKEAEPAACLVSKWGGRWSKEAYSAVAIALRAAARRSPAVRAPAAAPTEAKTHFARAGRSEHSEGVRAAPRGS